MVPWNTVVFSEVTLGLVPEILDAVDMSMLVGHELLEVIDPMVMEAGDIENVVDAEGVGEDDGIRHHLACDDGQNGFLSSIRDHSGIHLAPALEYAEDGDFADSAAATLSLAGATEVRFVDFDLAVEGRGDIKLASDDFTQSMIEQRSRVTVDADQFGSSAGWGASHKMFQQFAGLSDREARTF